MTMYKKAMGDDKELAKRVEKLIHISRADTMGIFVCSGQEDLQ